jgi:hypothetical protein
MIIGKREIFMIGVLVVSCLACKKEQISQPVQKTPFEQWRSLHLRNYTMDQRVMCFCLAGGRLVRITVHSDTIANVINTFNSSTVTYPNYRTIDDLFGIIKDHSFDSVIVRYNTQYGYPEYLDIDPQLHPVDSGILFETSNLKIP